MANLLMCRICLATDVRLCSITSHLRDMYERISSIPFLREDGRPLVACYICLARLRNCYRLRTSCIRSEELLTKMLSSVLKPLDVLSTNTFRIVSALHSSLGHKVQNSTECHVKEEASEIICDAELKDLVTEAQQEQCGLIDDNNQCSHLDDPLNAISTEADDVETVIIPTMTAQALDEELEIEDTFLEENEQNGGDLPSPSADNVCPKVVKVVLKRINVRDPRTDIVTDVQEEQSDNNQCLHLEDSLNLISTEADDVETVLIPTITEQEAKEAKDKELEIEDTFLEEIEQNGGDSPSQSADNVCPKVVKVVLKRIDLKVPRTVLIPTITEQEAKEAEDEELEMEDTVLEENEQFSSSFSSRTVTSLFKSADNTCPKIVKIVLKRIDLKDPRTGIPVCNQLAETDSHMVTDPEDHNLNKNIIFGKQKTNDKVGATLHKQRDKKVMVHYEGHKQTLKSNIRSINKPCLTKDHLDRDTCTRTIEKCLQCDVCNKCFKNRYNYRNHICTHIAKNRFHCDVCNKNLSSKQNLTQHMYTHTGEKRFQCDICNKCMNNKYYLKLHTDSHFVGKQFKCDVCNKYFWNKRQLTLHMYTHS